MNVLLWVLQGVLALMMLMAGGMKAAKSRNDLLGDPRMGWVDGFSDSTVRTIGLLELAAAVGLVLPWVLDIAPVLTPLAAVGVVALMIGAALTHRRRGEMQAIGMNTAIAVIAIAIAVGRLGDL